MKRIVSILAVLALLLCSTAALAAAPTLSDDLPKRVYYGTEEPVFNVTYNGSKFRWMSVWKDERGTIQYDNSDTHTTDTPLFAFYPGKAAADDWLESHPGQKQEWVLFLLGEDFKNIVFDILELISKRTVERTIFSKRAASFPISSRSLMVLTENPSPSFAASGS